MVPLVKFSSVVAITVALLIIADLANNVVAQGYVCRENVWQHISSRANFSKYTPPINLDKEENKIQIVMALTDIIGLDELEESLTSAWYVILHWKDARLEWDALEFDNCYLLILPAHLIWIPDITIVNSDNIQMNSRFFNKDLDIAIRHDGTAVWKFFGQLSTSCSLEMTYYPFDYQSCNITFESVSRPADLLPLSPSYFLEKDDKIPMFSSSNNMWVATNTSVDYGTSADKDNSYFKLRLVMKRKPLYVLVNVGMPLALLCVITLMVFFLPHDQKISFCITTFLTFMVLALVITEHLPESSDHFPMLGVYTMLCMVYSVFVCFASTIVVAKSTIEDDVKPEGLLAKMLIRVDCFCSNLFCCKKSKTSNAKKPLQQEKNDAVENDFMLHDASNEKAVDGASKYNNNGDAQVSVSDGLDTQDTPTWSHLCDVMDRLFFAFFLLLNIFTALIMFELIPASIGFFKPVPENENDDE